MYKRQVPRNELLNILYGHGECVNPAGDLRMVVSRLRKRLRDYGILEYADIVTSGGVYRWKRNGLEVRLDAREFEETAAQALEMCIRDSLSTVMGGLSGSNIADAAMEAKMLVPEMTKTVSYTHLGGVRAV